MSTAPDDLTQDEIPADATYEELANRLDEVVARLEEGDLPLDEALRAYEQGVELVRRCNDLLDQAELRISELSTSLARPSSSDRDTAAMRSILFPDDEFEP